jgi:hypothetical protein
VSRVGLFSLLAFALLGAFMAWQSMSLTEATCDVCMAYQGRSQCRTVSAATREQAREGAIVNACAFISSGVTDSMACQRGAPLSERCW